jgi:hypothetical protein
LLDFVLSASLREVSVSAPLQLRPEDKLDLLRYLDEFHYWHSLDDERICKRCSRTITGRQIIAIKLQGRRSTLSLKCPTAGCASTIGEWIYANPMRAAKQQTDSPPPYGQAGEKLILELRTHRGNDAGPRRKERKPLFAWAPSPRALAARLGLLRPIATGLHAFRPVA